MPRTLEPEELDRQLNSLPRWRNEDSVLIRTVEFATFPLAISAVVKVADDAEAMNHHPDIDIRWRKVTFGLSTHSAGGLTQLDIELAHQIDEVVAAVGAK